MHSMHTAWEAALSLGTPGLHWVEPVQGSLSQHRGGAKFPSPTVASFCHLNFCIELSALSCALRVVSTADGCQAHRHAVQRVRRAFAHTGLPQGSSPRLCTGLCTSVWGAGPPSKRPVETPRRCTSVCMSGSRQRLPLRESRGSRPVAGGKPWPVHSTHIKPRVNTVERRTACGAVIGTVHHIRLTQPQSTRRTQARSSVRASKGVPTLLSSGAL